MTASDPFDSNLYAALRLGFPAVLDATAIESFDSRAGPPLTYTWRDLDRGSAMLANLFDALDLPPQSRIAVQVEKSVESLMLYLATLRAGHVYLPLNPAYKASELALFIEDATPAVVVCDPSQFGWVSKLAFRAGTAHVFTLDGERGGSLLQRASHLGDQHTPVARNASSLAAIVYTSGTTGRSKGAMLSHGNLLSNARVLKDYWDWRPGDVLIHALPIFHVHGLFVAIHGALLNGSRMLWFAKFSPREVIAQLPRASVFMGVPTLYTRLLAEPSLTPEACAAMRLFISGSAPLLRATFDSFHERSGHTILERYGMSETVMLTSNPCRPEDGERVGGTVGKPLPGVDVRVVDEAGAVCDAGRIGDVEVRGPNVFSGYWQLPEQTAEAFRIEAADGGRWFRTGDIGRFDEAGYLSIVGRAKDLIISGGFNVYPAEIEHLLDSFEGIAESAVVGVPHGDFGEAVIAVLVAKPGAQLDPAAILAEARHRIANFKLPKRLFIVDELPRNAMGKVQKSLLRQQHAQLFEP